jgi:hypothetical protein
VYGIAGLTNTTALGTPVFFVYGTRRVYGHIIGTKTRLDPNGPGMIFDILYFMGLGPIQGISDIQINDTPLDQFGSIGVDIRLGGADNATVVPGFEAVRAVWADNRALPVGTPIVYTTRSDTVANASVFFATPYLYTQATNGGMRPATHTIHMEYAPIATGTYTDAPGSPFVWTDATQSPRFNGVYIPFPTPGQWLIRLTLTSTTNQAAAVPTLYNVEEAQAETLTYPGWSLLGLHGIASAQIQSFEGMRASGLVQGRLIEAYNGTTYVRGFTANRAWCIRDLLVAPDIRRGRATSPSLIDDVSFMNAAQYFDSDSGHGISRDECNALLNERRALQDWLKILCSEGRAILTLSAEGKRVLLVDKPQSPGLLYAMPGNIVEGSVQSTQGDGQGALPNTLMAQFPDSSAAYQLQPYELVAPGAESEPVREQSVTIYTLTDIARVYWLMRYQLLRMRLVTRHFTWQAPIGALVSDPLDQVELSYETADASRGYSGFATGDSTSTRLVMDRLVPLSAGQTVQLTVSHRGSNGTIPANAIERTTVAIATSRDYGSLTLGGLVYAPQHGDVWALAPTTTAKIPVVIEGVDMADDGTIQLSAAEYQSSVHDLPTPPSPIGTGTQSVQGYGPPPLWDVSLVEQAMVQADGSLLDQLVFQITPSPVAHAGMVNGATSNTLTLDTTEPLEKPYATMLAGSLAGYYNGAVVQITDGTGVGQTRTVTADNRTTNTITVDTPWGTIPDGTSHYTLTWTRGNDTAGFDLLQAPTTYDGTTYGYGTFAPLTSVPSYNYQLTPDAGPYSAAYEFVPFDPQGRRQYQGAWRLIVFIQGITTAPRPPGDA